MSEKSSNNDKNAPLVIIGSGLAAYNLINEIRRIDSELQIVIYTADDGVYYSKPQLSTGFSANKTASDLAMRSAEKMAETLQIEINIFTPINAIDHEKQTITMQSGGSRHYSKLVIASGASCVKLPLKGDGIGKVHSVNDLLDYAKFRTLIKPENHVLVIGAGLIGCEYADDLTRAGHRVSVVDPLHGALANLLPPQSSKVLTENLSAAGINFYLGSLVEKIQHSGSGIEATLSNGEIIVADIVLSAVGIRPNIKLAQDAKLDCGKGVMVNDYLQTSHQSIYALGDCAEVKGKVLPYIAPLVAQAKALAKTLCGEVTEVHYGVMPIMVKTKLHPVVVKTPENTLGHWLIDQQQLSGSKARFVNDSGQLIGYALTGDQCRENAKLMRECLN